MDVNAENIKYLNLWDSVNISKNDLTSDWKISLLWAGAKTTSMFPVEISISDKNFSENVILWDFVDVFIQKNIWSQKYIIIPFSGLIVNSNGTYSVYVVWKDNFIEERKVEIWPSNSSEVVIKSWLKVWEKIVIDWTLNISIWDKIEEK